MCCSNFFAGANRFACPLNLDSLDPFAIVIAFRTSPENQSCLLSGMGCGRVRGLGVGWVSGSGRWIGG